MKQHHSIKRKANGTKFTPTEISEKYAVSKICIHLKKCTGSRGLKGNTKAKLQLAKRMTKPKESFVALVRTIYHTVTKTFRHSSMNPELPLVLLMAPTGVAAINIEGTTLNAALGIPKSSGYILSDMSDQRRTQTRISLSELKLIIIDEISIVSNITLLKVHMK